MQSLQKAIEYVEDIGSTEKLGEFREWMKSIEDYCYNVLVDFNKLKEFNLFDTRLREKFFEMEKIIKQDL